jgi:xanthine dehydrogenase iron-sulfur cluster and FAD-binding subunit A
MQKEKVTMWEYLYQVLEALKQVEAETWKALHQPETTKTPENKRSLNSFFTPIKKKEQTQTMLINSIHVQTSQASNQVAYYVVARSGDQDVFLKTSTIEGVVYWTPKKDAAKRFTDGSMAAAMAGTFQSEGWHHEIEGA